jgi:prepilin signal peptidase PulO-like enzyme (type II secretory pathway)
LNFEYIVISLLFGAVFSLILIPLTRQIPLRMHAAWRQEILEATDIVESRSDSNNYALSLLEKSLLVIASLAVVFSTLTKFGVTREGILFCIFLEFTLLLAAINFKHQLLPNGIVFPLLWLGLLSHAIQGGGANEIFGAAIGYIIPFTIVQIIKFKTGKNALGLGDMKCFAMLGAWLGVSALPTLFIVFSVTALISSILINRFKETAASPTGLAHFAAAVAVTFGLKLF